MRNSVGQVAAWFLYAGIFTLVSLILLSVGYYFLKISMTDGSGVLDFILVYGCLLMLVGSLLSGLSHGSEERHVATFGTDRH